MNLRTVLSLLGIAWGTFAILVMLAFSVGMEELFAARAAGLGDAVAIAWPSRTSKNFAGVPAGRRVIITRNDAIAAAASVPELEASSVEYRSSERISTRRAAARVVVCGVDPTFGALRALAPRRGGRFVDDRDVAQRRRVIFLGDNIAERLFGSEDPVGAFVDVGGTPFRVIGVLETKEQDSDYGGLDTNLAFVPSTTIEQMRGLTAVRNIVYRARDPARQDECNAGLIAALGRRLRFDPTDSQALSIWDTTEQLRMIQGIFLGFHSIVAIAGIVTLLAGAIGIAHLLHLDVRQRRAEFGLALAVGARPVQVLRMVLRRSLFLVGSGGLAGALLAVVIVEIAGRGPWVVETGVPRIPWWLGSTAVGLLLASGVSAGMRPARLAAQLDPVDSLRG
ncbi:MAG: ABC transporter permease [Planctomycetota bacterium]